MGRGRGLGGRHQQLQHLYGFCLILPLFHKDVIIEFKSNYSCQIISYKIEASETTFLQVPVQPWAIKIKQLQPIFSTSDYRRGKMFL